MATGHLVHAIPGASFDAPQTVDGALESLPKADIIPAVSMQRVSPRLRGKKWCHSPLPFAADRPKQKPIPPDAAPNDTVRMRQFGMAKPHIMVRLAREAERTRIRRISGRPNRKNMVSIGMVGC